MGSWKYYLNAMLPDCLPHEEADVSVFADKAIWRQEGWKNALFAKYTSQWDCEMETGWYWCIKDTPFDLGEVKSKYRYEIRKGIENFDVRVIDPPAYIDELYDVTVDALSQYPKAYRNVPDKESFIQQIPTWKKPCFAAFDKETDALCGYINMVERGKVLLYSGHRVKQACEARFVNHALVYGMLRHYNERLSGGGYLVDGERNVNHSTAFQEFLCKKFHFRKANCRLNVVYRPGIGFAVRLLYVFRKIFRRLDKISFIHKINAVLTLEEICRKQPRAKKND